MIGFIKSNSLFILGLIFIVFFFNKVFINGLLPIPSDNIVGVYHPYRDLYEKEFPRGIPFQNVQVSDPVRQQYLWKELSITQMKNGELPLWNPYNFSGYPLLANFQSAVFYPLNLIMFVLPFEYGWTALIISQPLLAFVFMFLYLRNLKLTLYGSFIGSIAFSFSGFFVSWLEWGNVASTGLWLPLVLLAIDKIVQKTKKQNARTNKIWYGVFVLSLTSAFFAGHLQTFFYLFLVSFAYLILRWFEFKRSLKVILLFAVNYLLFTVLTAVQWIPTLQFVNLSARSIDQISTEIEGWFVPWQNMTQFIAPDFFGNPATLNYWGVWNYGEFIGYVGILPLMLALGVLLFKREKVVLFFGFVLLLGIIFAFPSYISNIPFRFDLPFVSTSQPTRIIFVISLALSILSGIGFDYFLKNPKKFLLPLLIIGISIVSFWGFVKFNSILPTVLIVSPENLNVTYSNLRLPTAVFALTLALWLGFIFFQKNKRLKIILIAIIFLIFLADIYRFADKYTVFAEKKYLYPETKVTSFLKENSSDGRIMEADARILPPNFTVAFRGESIDGYDPLYLLRYGELAAAISRGEPNINSPFGFNRIITPQTYHDPTMNGLNVKYLLSLTDIEDEGYVKVMEEGQTKVYENKEFIPRVFFADRTIWAENKYDAIEKYFQNKYDLKSVAIVESENAKDFDRKWSMGTAEISNNSFNKIIIKVDNTGDGYLVLLDSFYPTWKVFIDGVESIINRTNYSFRGVVVPGGSKEVVFVNNLF